jgi:hypothetical protein
VSRGSAGAELLLDRLRTAVQPRFVAGQVRVTSEGLRIDPVALIFENGTRKIIQPWIDRSNDSQNEAAATAADRLPLNPLDDLNVNLLAAVGELLLVGLRRADAALLRNWQELTGRAQTLGLERLAAPLDRLVRGLSQKAAVVEWDFRPTGRTLLELALITRIAQDLR